MTATTKLIYTEREVKALMEVNGKLQQHIIIEREIISGEPPEDFPRFIAIVGRPTKIAGPNGQPIMDQAILGFKTDDIADAFAELPAAIEAFEKQSKLNENKILLNVKPPMGFDPMKHANGFKPRITN